MNRRHPFAGTFDLVLMALAALAMLLATGQASAQLQPQGRNAIATQLVPEVERPAPGETVSLALVMKPEEGWHGYWKNPGDAGTEPRIEWDLPAGVSAGPLQYPVPGRLTISGLMNYVYEGDYAKLVDLSIDEGIAPGTMLPIRAKLDYLACTDEICVPESAQLSLDLRVGNPSGAMRKDARFDGYWQALPKPLGAQGRFEPAGETIRLAFPIPASMDVGEAYFYPATDGALDYAAEQIFSRTGDWLVLQTGAGREASSLTSIEGVLSLGNETGLEVAASRGEVPAAGVALSSRSAGEGEGSAILYALIGAILGGLLLNIMPCVFPILSLKALSLARVGGDEAAARREGLAYTAGVILTCLALGGALLALRSGGAAYGWAFQLQDPRVILLLLLLVTAIALNLAGLFELPALAIGNRLAHTGGAGGAFWTGALAAFVATPCTGPFMGAALGAALVLPTAAALAVFAGLGLGLALPFLALGFIPALRRRLPKPGAWMGRLRRILSVPMFLTALALAWILGRQAGVDGMAVGLAATLILALSLWWTGRRQEKGRAWLPLMLGAAGGVAALLLIPTAATAPAVARTQDALDSQPFSESRLAGLRSDGRPVFVYFTADWCVTCKINEKGALERAEVARAFQEKEVAVLVGDWTRGNPEIGRFLEKHGRSGVPLYLFYEPGKPVRVLPQVLTPGLLTELIG